MKPFSYGVCLYRVNDHKTEILLIRPKGHTDWGFIKGKIDKGETKEECAKRECKEETNISFKVKHLEDYFEQKSTKKNVGIFLIDSINCDLTNIILEEREIEEIKWFKIMDDFIINKNQQKILNKIIDKFIKRIYIYNKD